MSGDYLAFFGLNDHPFRLTPDTKYFFPSSKHKAVLDVIRYGIDRGDGFIVVIGAPGAGKTMLLRVLLKGLGSAIETALIISPTLEPKELLQAILEDLELSFSPSDTKEKLIKIFHEYLVQLEKEGKKLLLIIDEAQQLPSASIEEIRLLSNLETEEKKLFQIMLVGQPSLGLKLRSPELSQLTQRITIWENLEHLSPEETIWYVRHRLSLAGGGHIPIEKEAEKLLYRASCGIPRLINKVMDRTLLTTASKLQRRITKETMKEAILSLGPTLDSETLRYGIDRKKSVLVRAILVLITLIIAWVIWLFFWNRP